MLQAGTRVSTLVAFNAQLQAHLCPDIRATLLGARVWLISVKCYFYSHYVDTGDPCSLLLFDIAKPYQGSGPLLLKRQRNLTSRQLSWHCGPSTTWGRREGAGFVAVSRSGSR